MGNQESLLGQISWTFAAGGVSGAEAYRTNSTGTVQFCLIFLISLSSSDVASSGRLERLEAFVVPGVEALGADLVNILSSSCLCFSLIE